MMNANKHLGKVASLCAAVLLSYICFFLVPIVTAALPAGPIYELQWAGVSPGGGGQSSGGAFEATGTIGQPAAQSATGGAFASSGGVWANNIDSVCGDFDFDGDVDLSDFSQFSLCFGGANNPLPPSCPDAIDADCDNDGDVDLGDFATFALNFTGPT